MTLDPLGEFQIQKDKTSIFYYYKQPFARGQPIYMKFARVVALEVRIEEYFSGIFENS